MNRFSVLSFLILAIFLGSLNVEGYYVSFRLSDANSKSYRKFITSLRSVLPKAGEVFNIPLLVPTASGSGSYRLMQLSNYEEKTITVAIDVKNVYVLGYLVNTTSYFFNEPAAATASKFVFRNAAKSVTLPYSGNYEKLQTAADKKRENIPLGLPALSSAISTLYHYDAKSAAAALLVIIQTTAEASRFKYIEQQIVERLRVDEVPSRATISLENNWSALSKQIQLAQTNNGTFIAPVMLIDNTGQRVQINNVSSNVVAKNIMLLLNKQNIAAFLLGEK